jgi:hypothetical protein
MWRRFRSKSMAPRRPAVFPGQWPLLIVSLLVLAAGVGLAVWAYWS